MSNYRNVSFLKNQLKQAVKISRFNNFYATVIIKGKSVSQVFQQCTTVNKENQFVLYNTIQHWSYLSNLDMIFNFISILFKNCNVIMGQIIRSIFKKPFIHSEHILHKRNFTPLYENLTPLFFFVIKYIHKRSVITFDRSKYGILQFVPNVTIYY